MSVMVAETRIMCAISQQPKAARLCASSLPCWLPRHAMRAAHSAFFLLPDASIWGWRAVMGSMRLHQDLLGVSEQRQ